MAVSYTATAWNSNGTDVGGDREYKDITLTGLAVGDLIVIIGFCADAASAAAGTIVKQSGTATTGTWTDVASSGTSGSCGWTSGHAEVTGAGDIVLRVTVPRASAVTFMGVAAWVIPADEWAGTPAWTTLPNNDTNGQVNVTTSATSSHVLYGGADWTAADPGTGSTPTGATNDTTYSDGTQYAVAVRRWSGRAAGTTSYGPSAPSGDDWGGRVLVVEETGGGPPPEPIPVSVVAVGAASTTGDTTPLTVPIPSGAAENDVLYAIIHLKDLTGSSCTATDWVEDHRSAELGSGTVGAGTGPSGIVVMKRVVPAGGLTGSVDFTMVGSPNSYQGQMMLCRYDATGYTNPSWPTLTGTSYSRTATNSSVYGGTGAANLDLDAGDVLAFVSITPDDASTNHDNGNDHTLTATGATLGTLTKVGTAVTSTGGDCSMFLSHRPVTAGPSTAAPVSTLTGNSPESGGGVFLRIRATGVPSGPTTHAMSATIPATGATTGALASTQGMTATTAASSSLSGALSSTQRMASTIPATSGASAAFGVVSALAAVIAAQSASTGSLDRVAALAATTAATSGTPAPALAPLTLALAATTPAVSTSSGSLGRFATLTATIAATSTLSGSLDVIPGGGGPVTHALAATIPATGATTGNLSLTARLSATLPAVSALTGTMRLVGTLASTIPAVSTSTGAMTRGVPLAATIPATSTLTGTMRVTLSLSATVPATSGLSADLSRVAALAATMAAVSGFSGSMTASGDAPALPFPGRIAVVTRGPRSTVVARGSRTVTVIRGDRTTTP